MGELGLEGAVRGRAYKVATQSRMSEPSVPWTWWRATSRRSDLALDALDQAICERSEAEGGPLVHHSDRGSQYLSIRCTERLAEAGIEPSVPSRGDSYDEGLAETVIGRFKTEIIRRRGP